MKSHSDMPNLAAGWQTTVINPAASLEEVVRVMDKSGLRIALVVDPDRRLVGTITDGDVRRALLRGSTLAVTAAEVMHREPRTARPDWNRERILAVMEQTRLLQLPIIKEDGVIFGLVSLHDVLHPAILDNPVLLMAGGFGKRLAPLTEDCPKPLLKVGGKPILELILEKLAGVGLHKFFFSTHYLPEMIRNHFGDGRQWGVDIYYIHEDQPLGTGGALGLLPHAEISRPLLMMNGDLLTDLDVRALLEFHEQGGSVATMCAREYEYQVPYGVIEAEEGVVRQIAEKPVQRFHVNAGIYVLSPEIVRRVSHGQSIDVPTLLGDAMRAGDKVSAFPIHEYWLDIGRMDDFKRAQVEFGDLAR